MEEMGAKLRGALAKIAAWRQQAAAASGTTTMAGRPNLAASERRVATAKTATVRALPRLMVVAVPVVLRGVAWKLAISVVRRASTP